LRSPFSRSLFGSLSNKGKDEINNEPFAGFVLGCGVPAGLQVAFELAFAHIGFRQAHLRWKNKLDPLIGNDICRNEIQRAPLTGLQDLSGQRTVPHQNQSDPVGLSVPTSPNASTLLHKLIAYGWRSGFCMFKSA